MIIGIAIAVLGAFTGRICFIFQKTRISFDKCDLIIRFVLIDVSAIIGLIFKNAFHDDIETAFLVKIIPKNFKKVLDKYSALLYNKITPIVLVKIVQLVRRCQFHQKATYKAKFLYRHRRSKRFRAGAYLAQSASAGIANII